MKKKGMFLTSILLCVAMIMTNFAGLGNSIAKVKADPTEYEISFCVNDDSIGEVRGGIIFQENEGNYILKTDPVPGINGVEGDRVLLSVRYKDYKDEIYKIKKWKITPESGSIEEKNGRYIYTIGTENVEIQAIFEEKDSYTVSMEDWIYGKGEKRPTYIDENGDTIPVEEVIYFVNETCNEGTYEEPKDETTPENSGAEDIGRAPIKPGKYYAKFMLFGGGNYKTEYVILPFCIRETVEIKPNNIEIPYIPEENTYPVAELFEIPENAGDRTYSIVSQSSEQGVGTGTLEEDNNLTITKCGKFEIKVTTAQTDKAVTGSAIAVLTVNPAVFSNDTTSLTLNDEVYAYSGSLCSPVLTVNYGETELTEGEDYEIDTKESTIEAKDVGIYPVRIKGIGNYTGFASTTWEIKDSTAPTISISGEKDEDVYCGPVSVTVSDDNLKSVTLKIGDELKNIEIYNGNATINLTDLGVYSIIAYDKENNRSECSITIEQKEISITGQNKDITYDASKPYDLSGLFTVSDNTLIPEYSIVEGSGTGSISESGLTITKTGTFTIKAIIAEGTYNTYAEDTAVLNVSKADRDISVTINDVTYGTPVNISVSSTINTGSCTILYTGKAPTVYESSSTAPIGAGTYTATVTYPATDLYNVVEESVDFEITPATLTVKANDLSKKVETDDPELTYTVDGLKYNDKAADVLTGKLARVSGETIGDYNIVKGDLTANQNYTISFTGATFTINKKDSYNINVEKSIEEAGTITGAGNYEEGSSVILTATANPGYKFIEWQENNTKVGDNNNYSFTITKNTTIKAVFAEKNTPALCITVNPQWTFGDSSDGKISFSGNTENGTEKIVYYIDSDYTIETNATNSGAGVEGGIPKYANTYYVKYSVGETENYKATTTQTSFIINGKPISNCTLSLDRTSFNYVVGTTSYSPLLTVKDGETSLNEGTDYDIVTNESTTSANKVGSYTIKVNGKGNYAGTSSINWTVNDITAPEITGVANKSTNYGPVTFNVSDDYLSSVTIQEANDAQATTINVINGTSASGTKTELGSYIVTATDQAGNVSTCSFTIAQENITITAKTAAEDTTTTYAPSATFDVSGLFVIPENAGTATYSVIASTAEGSGAGTLGSDNKTLTITKAGTITIKVSTDESDYVATAEKTALLFVNRANITKNMLSLNQSSFDYIEGTTPYAPKLTVKDGETTLKEDTDYEIDTNASIQSASTVGTYIIKVYGKGNYTGTQNIEWNVKDITKPVISGIEDNSTHYGPVTFNVSDDYLASVTVKKDTNEAVSITINNGSVSQNVTDLGSYTLTATDNAGNVSTCSFTIAQEVITLNAKTEAKDTTFTYDPNTIFDVSSLFNDILEKSGTVSYSIVPSETEGAGAGTLGEDGKTLTVTKAGIITIKVNTSGSTYVAPAEATASFTVKKAKGNINVTINNVTYGTAVSPIVGSTTNTGNYSIVYKNNAITNDAIASNIPVEVGSYTATVTYPENDLYEKVEASVNFDITPATLTVVANNIIKKVESKDPELTYAVNGLQYNDTATNVISGKLVRSTGEDAGKEYPILQGDLKANKNYTISFTGATFTITPKDIYTVSIEKNINEAGNVTESGSYVEGSEVNLTATANSGYKFVEWQGKETKAKVSDLSSFKYTVSSNRNLVAVFEKKKDLTLTLTAVSGTYGDSNIGDVTLKVFDGDVSLNIFDEKVKDITEYFTDESCSVKTNTINGADTEGGIPKFVGTYYVKVTVPETDDYKSASATTSFTINALTPVPGPEPGPGPEPETNKVIWSKESVDWLVNFNDDSKTAKATFHLKDNSTPANSVSVDADNIVVVMFLDGTQKTFKATLKYNGYEFEDETTVKMHTEHKWSEPSWDWMGTNATNSVANATFKCTISGQEHQVTLTATTTEKKRKSNKVVYSAVVTGPDKKTYTSAYTLTWTADGNETAKEGDGIEIGNGIVIIGLEDEYDYTGKQIKPAFQVIDENRNDEVLALNVDYTVKYGANKDAGEKAGTIEVKGKGNYTGAATSATFAIVNRRAELSEDEQKELVNLKGASVRISEKFTYTGAAQYPKSFELKLKGGSWTKYDTKDGITYTAGDNELKAVVTFSNNVNKGTATMLIEGATDDKGKITAVKKNFSIKAADLKDAKFADDMEGTYTVKGAKPDKLVVTWQANDDSEILTLVEGQDFKVKYSDNKAAGTGKIVITGKGNFTKKAEGGTFKINPMQVEAEDISVIVSDKTAANKVKVTILDAEGNALNQNKQLNVTVYNEEGTDLGKIKVKSGDKIIVNVTSKDTNNVIIDEAGIDVEVLVGTKLSKAKVAVNGYTTTYTGVPVELDDEAFNTIKVTIKGKELKIHEDFEIAGYKNNNNKGTMTVTIRGIENISEDATPVSGTKTFKVKINAKSLN